MKILFGGHISNMPLFLDEDYLKAANTTGEKFISTHGEGLNLFKSVLDACTTIYSVPKESIHIFYDIDSTTYAFNRANSLFFNYRMFIQRQHLAMMQRGHQETPICVWSGIMAHEIAHNLESDHGVRFMNIWQDLEAMHLVRAARIATAATASSAGAAAQPAPPAQSARQAAPAARSSQPPRQQSPPSRPPPPRGSFGAGFRR
ncbi:MAG: hypothetical protein Q9184_008166 [Pyrenodesmia sp. 2 TL-2023]